MSHAVDATANLPALKTHYIPFLCVTVLYHQVVCMGVSCGRGCHTGSERIRLKRPTGQARPSAAAASGLDRRFQRRHDGAHVELERQEVVEPSQRGRRGDGVDVSRDLRALRHRDAVQARRRRQHRGPGGSPAGFKGLRVSHTPQIFCYHAVRPRFGHSIGVQAQISTRTSTGTK